MDQAAAIAIGTLILGAVLGGAVQAITAWLGRRREGRAAALVIGGALTDALERTHEPQMHPVHPVVIAFDGYIKTWDAERKPLALTMSAADYAVISEAFAKLQRIRRDEEIGGDLREQVFDSLLDAGQACEMARRVTWSHAQSPRDRVRRWFRLRRKGRRTDRELRKLEREARRLVREQSDE